MSCLRIPVPLKSSNTLPAIITDTTIQEQVHAPVVCDRPSHRTSFVTMTMSCTFCSTTICQKLEEERHQLTSHIPFISKKRHCSFLPPRDAFQDDAFSHPAPILSTTTLTSSGNSRDSKMPFTKFCTVHTRNLTTFYHHSSIIV